MTTRRKSKQQNDSTTPPIDEKEHADRIAAAEAMSCLSSMVVLPSNSDDLFALAGGLNAVESKTVSKETSKSISNKKGKTRTRANKNSPPANKSNNNDSVSVNNKQKTKPSKNLANSSVNNKVQSKLPDQVLSLTINPRNPFHEQKKVEVPKILTQELKKKDNLQPPKLMPVYNIEQSGTSKPCLIQVDHSKPGLGLYGLSSNDLHKLLAGKVPFQVKADSQEIHNNSNKSTTSKLVSNNDGIQLSQTAVENLINHMVLKQKAESKESSESSLPLKKRRLQGYKEDEAQSVDDSSDKNSESSNVEGSINSAVRERVNPVAVDPSTSLMLLNEMQVALQQDEDGDLPLHIAVVHENIVMVQKFVHLMSISGKSVDKYNKAQQTPLHIAIELKFALAVHTLLLAGSNPNLVNKNGENCVHMAVKANSLDCLHLLFKFSQSAVIDVDARNFDGLAPIHVAVMKNNIEIVKFLLAEKADVNIQDGKSGRTPLFYAVEANNVAMVELFQKVGANLDLPNYASVSAVMAAQAKGFHEVASMLLRCMDSKAYLEMKEKEKGTPLKKEPIPRIPSKSHLIQSSDTKPTLVDLHQLTNSDSNDSTQSSTNSRKRNKNFESKNGIESIKPIETEKDGGKPEVEQNGVQNFKTEETSAKENNSEAILIPRELLEKLQNTMLTLLAMQKVQQGPGSTVLPVGPSTQGTSGLNLANVLLQNAFNKNKSNLSNLNDKTIENAFNKNNASLANINDKSTDISAKNISNDAKTLPSSKTHLIEKGVKSRSSNVLSENQYEIQAKHAMLQQLLNVKRPDINNSLEKSNKTVEVSSENSIERKVSVENEMKIQRQKSVENSGERCQIQAKTSVRLEEPMEISDSSNGSETSQLSPKNVKNQGSIGHAAMNQLGKVTNVSNAMRATLLQMLQAKQNMKPLNLTTSKNN